MLWSVGALICNILPCELAGQWFDQIQHPACPQLHKVAIIGAGAAGSSAAFWLAKAQQRNNLPVSIDIFESASYVGGRSTVVYPYDNINFTPIELGASIFVPANKNLMRASKEFNLTLLKVDDNDGETGVWDGSQFHVKLGGNWWSSLWNKAQIVWKYGIKAPSRTQKLVNSMLTSFMALYSKDPPRWNNVQEAIDKLDLSQAFNQTASDFLDSHDVNPHWTREVVEAATRVNYGQNVDAIHAMGGMVSMAAEGAYSVKGGNFQIFQHFIKASKANLHLNSTVTRLEHMSSQWLIETPDGVKLYDTVIIAAPLTSELPILPEPAFAPTKYVQLHVTLITTTSPKPNSTYFSGDSRTPTTILTSYEGARNGGKEPPFNSISYHGRTSPEKDEFVVKIFSKSRPSNKWLNKIFNNQVGWVHHKLWKAYPILTPSAKLSGVILGENLYYVNAFEPFISTMETETVASRNVVDVLLSAVFNTTICGESSITQADRNDFVYGWDC